MSNDSPKSACVLHDLAEALVAHPGLKAIWLDAANKRVSLAFAPGCDNEETRAALKQVVARHKPGEIPECGEDTWRVVCELCERGTRRTMPTGIRMVSMPEAGVMLEKETCPTAPRFWKWTQFPWVKIQARQIEAVSAGDDAEEHDWRIPMMLAALCGLATLAGFLTERVAPPIIQPYAILAYLVAFGAGAWHPAIEVIELLRKRVLDIHFLMLCVAVGAAFIGHWWEGAVLLFLFSLSGALEELAMARTRRAIHSLFKGAPKEATVIGNDGSETTISLDDIQPGMVVRVLPGGQFPVDAVVIKGETGVDESTLTGEAMPVEKRVGDSVFSGTMNTWGAVDCRVERRPSESALAKIIRLIREAQESKAPSQRFTDNFGSRYTIAILLLSLAMFFVWWLGFGLPPFVSDSAQVSAFYRTMTLLVVASPCALVLSIPSAILAGIAAGARRGILFRGGIAIENLSAVDRVAMDKTGTLTTGELALAGLEGDLPHDELLTMAAALARHSTHPVSRAIFAEWKKMQGRADVEASDSLPAAKLPEVASFRSIPGMGVEGILDGRNVRLGRREMFASAPWLDEYAAPEPGITETLIAWGGTSHGRILLADSPRNASRPLIENLTRHGVGVAMLTGDRPESAHRIAAHVGVKKVLAGLHPEDKVAAIRKWREQGHTVAMIGDGVNDAPSLAAADVAVGMGFRGSDAVLEQADIILMHDKLENFYEAYTLSRRARTIIRQNLTISLGVIAVLVISALGFSLPLTLGVIGHEGSTVVVVLNSLRLLSSKKY